MAREQRQADAVCGADREPAHGLGFVGEVGAQFEAADHGGEHEDGLLGGKGGAGADARACAEGDEGAAGGLFALVCGEAVGVKNVWSVPMFAVSVEEPWGDEDGAALFDLFVAHFVGLGGLSRDEADGRVEPEGLAEDVPDEFEAAGVAVLKVAGADFAGDFFEEPGLDVWAVGDEVEGPGQSAGGGFMACEEEHADLVEDFGVGEAVVQDGILGFEKAGENVAREREGLLCRSEAFLDDLGEDGADLGCGLFASAVLEEGRQTVDEENGGALGVVLEGEEGVVDGVGVGLFEGLREDGAEHDVSGDAGHFGIDLEVAAVGEGIEAGEHVLDGLEHAGENGFEPALGEGLVDEAALAFPDGAVGGEDAVAQERLEQAVHEVLLWVEGGVAAEDAFDEGRLVDHVDVGAALADVAHFHGVAFFKKNVQPGMPAPDEAPKKGAFCFVGPGIGRGEGHWSKRLGGNGQAVTGEMIDSDILRSQELR